MMVAVGFRGSSAGATQDAYVRINSDSDSAATCVLMANASGGPFESSSPRISHAALSAAENVWRIQNVVGDYAKCLDCA